MTHSGDIRPIAGDISTLIKLRKFWLKAGLSAKAMTALPPLYVSCTLPRLASEESVKLTCYVRADLSL